MVRSVISMATLGVVATLAAGSTEHPLQNHDPVGVVRVEQQVVPVHNRARALDLLFVVDNSSSMAEGQAALRAIVASFVDVLTSFEGGLPNIRIGVISTDVGTGGVTIGRCSPAAKPRGDDGRLLTNGCAGLTAPFIEDILRADGSRRRNYAGDLAGVLGCMVSLGVDGCDFPQPLESLYRALQPGNNPGFLRDDANLVVIIASDGDDCSAKGPELFRDGTASTTSVLGPRTAFRCFEHGVTCADDPEPRAFGTKTGCVPTVGSRYLRDVQTYAAFLKRLKANPRKISVAGIIGPVDAARTVSVIPDPDDATRAALGPSCRSAAGQATPAVRLQAFLTQFPDRHGITSICDADLTDALTVLETRQPGWVVNPCLESPLADQNPDLPGLQHECSVTDVTSPNGPNRTETVIPACARAGDTPPCWRFISDPVRCATASDNRAIEVDRGDAIVPDDTVLQVQCVVEP
ncbi:MAG: VWA domain-containing protein [Kofleriaceae bacterium]